VHNVAPRVAVLHHARRDPDLVAVERETARSASSRLQNDAQGVGADFKEGAGSQEETAHMFLEVLALRGTSPKEADGDHILKKIMC